MILADGSTNAGYDHWMYLTFSLESTLTCESRRARILRVAHQVGGMSGTPSSRLQVQWVGVMAQCVYTYKVTVQHSLPYESCADASMHNMKHNWRARLTGSHANRVTCSIPQLDKAILKVCALGQRPPCITQSSI